MPQLNCTCGTALNYPATQAGKKIRCLRCQAIVETPTAALPASEKIMVAEALPTASTGPQAIQAGQPGRATPPRPYDSDRDRDLPDLIEPTRHSAKAIWSLILSFPTLFFSIVTAIPSIILGILAIRDCNRNPRLGGSGLAVAGMVISGMLTALNGFVLLMLVPAVSNVRASAARMQELNNIKQMSLAVHGYNDVYKKMPDAYSNRGRQIADQQEHCLFVQLLPYMEQQPLFQQPHLLPRGQNERGAATVPMYLSPHEAAKDTNGRINFAGNIRVFSDKGAMAQVGAADPLEAKMENQLALHRIQDGTSNTACFATRFGECGHPSIATLFDGMRPNTPGSPFFGAGTHSVAADDAAAADRTFQLLPITANCQPNASIYGHAFTRQGLAVGLCDGSTRVISPSISPLNFQRFLCPSDGNAVDLGN
ncbi:MAG: DUF1559 domain-containing protein [Gemmataceae bacterium]|nr:DUF1559 domain-containing protein [Gemmataceae bacterium]